MDLVEPKDLKPADQAWGLRRPGTNHGEWNGAFVYEKIKNQRITGTFVREEDYIGFPKSENEITRNYAFFRAMNWYPMNGDDIWDTAGVLIDKNTDMNVPEPSLLLRLWCLIEVNIFGWKQYLK